MSEIFKLPNGWIEASIGEICTLVNGRAFKPTEWSSQGLPIIRIQNLNNPDAYYNYCNLTVDDKYYVSDGDLLFAWSGTPGTSFGAHIWRNGRAVLNQHIFRVDINEEKINKRYLMHIFNYKVDEYIRKAHGTAGLAHITKKKFQESFLPLPPFNEQHRIIAIVEELFTKLDAGMKAMKQVQAQLKRYRQSVLKAAVEGKLTAEWREQHKYDLESADNLLERIQEVRKTKLGKKYKEPTPPDTSKLPKLSERWKWASLSQLGDWHGGGTPSKAEQIYWANGQIPWVSPKDMKVDFIKDTQDHITSIALEKFATRIIPKNSLLFVTRSGILRHLLPVAINKVDVTVNQDLKALTTAQEIEPLFLFIVVKAFNRDILYSCSKDGTTVQSIETPQLYKYAVPIPPKLEQLKIIELVDHILLNIEKSELVIESELKRAQSLRQPILKHAFEGKLVPQNPNDEPASVLLERIKTEKAKSKKSKQMEMF